jgi:hypothetical protein
VALPGWAYGDPARIVEADDIRTKGCSVCARAVFVGGDVLCGAGLKLPGCKRDKKNGYKLAASAGG